MNIALDKHWHLAENDYEIELSELEFSLLRVIEKASTSDSKKGVTYVVTELGRRTTDKYAQFRRELLLTLTQSISTENSLGDVGRVLNLMAGMYDQAACIAAAHRIST